MKLIPVFQPKTNDIWICYLFIFLYTVFAVPIAGAQQPNPPENPTEIEECKQYRNDVNDYISRSSQKYNACYAGLSFIELTTGGESTVRCSGSTVPNACLSLANEAYCAKLELAVYIKRCENLVQNAELLRKKSVREGEVDNEESDSQTDTESNLYPEEPGLFADMDPSVGDADITKSFVDLSESNESNEFDQLLLDLGMNSMSSNDLQDNKQSARSFVGNESPVSASDDFQKSVDDQDIQSFAGGLSSVDTFQNMENADNRLVDENQFFEEFQNSDVESSRSNTDLRGIDSGTSFYERPAAPAPRRSQGNARVGASGQKSRKAKYSAVQCNQLLAQIREYRRVLPQYAAAGQGALIRRGIRENQQAYNSGC